MDGGDEEEVNVLRGVEMGEDLHVDPWIGWLGE